MTAAPPPEPPSGDTASRERGAIPLAALREKDVALRRTRRRVLHRNARYIAAVAVAVALTLLALVALVRWAP